MKSPAAGPDPTGPLVPGDVIVRRYHYPEAEGRDQAMGQALDALAPWPARTTVDLRLVAACAAGASAQRATLLARPDLSLHAHLGGDPGTDGHALRTALRSHAIGSRTATDQRAPGPIIVCALEELVAVHGLANVQRVITETLALALPGNAHPGVVILLGHPATRS